MFHQFILGRCIHCNLSADELESEGWECHGHESLEPDGELPETPRDALDAGIVSRCEIPTVPCDGIESQADARIDAVGSLPDPVSAANERQANSGGSALLKAAVIIVCAAIVIGLYPILAPKRIANPYVGQTYRSEDNRSTAYFRTTGELEISTDRDTLVCPYTVEGENTIRTTATIGGAQKAFYFHTEADGIRGPGRNGEAVLFLSPSKYNDLLEKRAKERAVRDLELQNEQARLNALQRDCIDWLNGQFAKGRTVNAFYQPPGQSPVSSGAEAPFLIPMALQMESAPEIAGRDNVYVFGFSVMASFGLNEELKQFAKSHELSLVGRTSIRLQGDIHLQSGEYVGEINWINADNNQKIGTSWMRGNGFVGVSPGFEGLTMEPILGEDGLRVVVPDKGERSKKTEDSRAHYEEKSANEVKVDADTDARILEAVQRVARESRLAIEVEKEKSSRAAKKETTIYSDDFSKSGNDLDPLQPKNHCKLVEGGEECRIAPSSGTWPTSKGLVLRFKLYAPKSNFPDADVELQNKAVLQVDVYDKSGSRVMFDVERNAVRAWQDVELRIKVPFDAKDILIWNKMAEVKMRIDDLKVVVEASNAREETGGIEAMPFESFAVLRARVLKSDEISSWEQDRVRLAINYLYAIHGYPFAGPKEKDLQKIFSEQRWYEPVVGVTMEQADQLMSEIEASNVRVLAAARASMAGKAGGDPWKEYVNPRFGFKLRYPPGLESGAIPQNGAGQEFHSPDRAFYVVAQAHFLKGTLDDAWNDALKTHGRAVKYKRKGSSWYVVSGVLDNGTEFYEKFFTKDKFWSNVRITYPHSRNKEFDPWVERIEKEFVPFLDGQFGDR